MFGFRTHRPIRKSTDRTITMTLGGFFSGGAKGITWPEQPGTPGGRTGVTGTIEIVHPPEPVVDIKTGQPTDKQQVRIVLATDERDPSEPDDDGRRTLYVKSYMRGAIGDALRKAGAKEPEVGGTLTVTFTHVTPPDRPGMSPSKHFAATYTAPPVTGGYFAPPAAPAVTPGATYGAPAQPAPVPPAVQQAFPGATQVPQPTVAPEPVKPAAISDAAWAAMDAPTRATVAATMGGGADRPSF
ncbi:hypothetical protein SEA_RYADEL_17 [Mycobacterium phage Ryadel]|uniref:Uncharacterized protein n=1 Tax=Mycobacterium phage Ryadel TaxID=2283292 RepID=A0A345MEZ1_9CAUD|nr:hypothetical protein KNU03_gp017 [Mycobacterium phage Ryadel]AXH69122.1 hypothetical protein SEA_RYADEL_17 [Mycobacterium phage Ryadel]